MNLEEQISAARQRVYAAQVELDKLVKRKNHVWWTTKTWKDGRITLVHHSWDMQGSAPTEEGYHYLYFGADQGGPRLDALVKHLNTSKFLVQEGK